MNSRTSRRFRECFADLPTGVQERARKAYLRFRDDRAHPGLRFKKVHGEGNVYSMRISRDYRALGIIEGDDIIWFWIGSHDDYEELLEKL